VPAKQQHEAVKRSADARRPLPGRGGSMVRWLSTDEIIAPSRVQSPPSSFNAAPRRYLRICTYPPVEKYGRSRRNPPRRRAAPRLLRMPRTGSEWQRRCGSRRSLWVIPNRVGSASTEGKSVPVAAHVECSDRLLGLVFELELAARHVSRAPDRDFALVRQRQTAPWVPRFLAPIAAR